MAEETREISAEERAKFAAEAAKAQAEADQIKAEEARLGKLDELEYQRVKEEVRTAAAEASAREAEAAAAHSNARTAEALAQAAEIQRDREVEKRNLELAADTYHFTYNFNKAVDEASVTTCVRQLSVWQRQHQDSAEKPTIEIVFDSPGGSVIDGMHLYDHIKTMQHQGWVINTTARGYAASMGGILLQAGTVRRMGAEAYILIHEISTVAYGKTGEIEDEMLFVKKIQERVLRIFAARSNGKVSVATLRQKWRRKDWWLDSTEALRLGIVDEIG